MARPIKPQKVTANGKDSWWFVPAIADTSAPTATEIQAGVNISCYLLAEQEGVTGTAERVQLARLLCETSTTEALGDQTWSLADIQGVFDPQAASGEPGKAAWEEFQEPLNEGYLVRRQGVIADSEAPEATAGQFVDVFTTEVGQATPTKNATDASGIYTFTAPVALVAKPDFNVEVASGA